MELHACGMQDTNTPSHKHTYRWYEVREEIQDDELRTDNSIIQDLESARAELMDPFGNISNCLCVSACVHVYLSVDDRSHFVPS
jgi:hypothetical protein